MIHTSNFSKAGKYPNTVSIARGTPHWFKRETYPDLFPTWTMINLHKKRLMFDKEYTDLYYNILNNLDAEKVYKELDNKVLLCWCAKDKFCHRRIVAEWLEEKLNIKVTELSFKPY